MPKITLHIPIEDIEPILKGIECAKMLRNNCPYIDSYETKLFWEGWDAVKYEDSLFVNEIEIFNGYDITFKNK